MAADCKSAGVMPTVVQVHPGPHYAGVAQLVEHQPSKLRVAGSNPVSRSRNLFLLILLVAGWSSQVARRAHNPKVEGSNPSPATILSVTYRLCDLPVNCLVSI